MSKSLTFTTHDVTPEQWDDFAKTAGIQLDADDPDDELYVPFVLIHSRTQTNLEETQCIDAPVTTDFSSASWKDTKSAFRAFCQTEPKTILPTSFLILEQELTSNRKVAIIEKTAEWFNSDGSRATVPEGTKWTVWNRYAVPYEEVQAVIAAFMGCCDLWHAHGFFERELEREICVEEEEESEEEEEDTDTDETTSEDLEYGDFPIKSK